MITRFQQIEEKRYDVEVKCKKCKKKLKRVFSEMQTVNPWNTHKDGTPRSADEIRENVRKDLAKQIRKVKREGVLCRKCDV